MLLSDSPANATVCNGRICTDGRPVTHLGRGVKTDRLFLDPTQYFHARATLVRRDTFQKLSAQLRSDSVDLLKQRVRLAAKVHCLDAPVTIRPAPLDPAVGCHSIEQPGERGTFHAQTLSQLLLRDAVGGPGKLKQCDPFRLAQPERLETLIEPITPRTASLAEQCTESREVRRLRHR